MTKAHYLTVQDVIWLNTNITDAPQTFDSPRLEDGVFYQYALDNSTNIPKQAARLLVGFPKKRPFATGNKATALAAFLVFLKLNGHHVSGDVVATVAKAWAGEDVTGSIAANAHSDHHLDVSHACREVLTDYSDAIKVISAAEAQELAPLESAR